MTTYKQGDKVRITDSPFTSIPNGEVMRVKESYAGWVFCVDYLAGGWTFKETEVEACTEPL